MIRIPLILAFLAGILLEVGVPIMASLWAVERLKVGWTVFGYGVITFALVGLGFLVPLTNWAMRRPGWLPWLVAQVGIPGSLTLVALVAALTQQVGRYLGFRILFRNLRRTWRRAVVFGLGYGSLQSVYLVGLPAVIAMADAIMLPQINPVGLSLTPQEAMDLRAAQQRMANMAVWLPLSDGAESVLTLLLQVALSVLVVQVFLRASRVWLLYAVALHLMGELAVLLGDAYAKPVWSLVALLAIAVGAGYWAFRLRPAPLPSTSS